MAKPPADKKVDVPAIDQLIRDGQLGLAREQLLATSAGSLDRSQVLPAANLARRLNMPRLMIRFLRPIVRDKRRLHVPATEAEIALYATALSRLGFFAEAEKLLKPLDANTLPEVLLYQAMNFMFQWDYVSPIPKLKKYVQSKSISDYERLVGYVNIAASYIWNMDWEKGRATVETIQGEIAGSPDPLSHRLIHGYSFELFAEMSILQQKYAEAEVYLSRAAEILSGSKSRYEFFVRKWRTISEVLQAGNTEAHLGRLRSVRDEAILLKDWETYRDCEFYEALASRNLDLFLKVFNGTPYESFRQRITKIFQPAAIPAQNAVWEIRPATPSEEPTLTLPLDVFQELQAKPLLANLFSLLCRDYYRPLHFDSLVSNLYPDEHFNPESSPKKAWQIVDRLRAWFDERGLPLDIQMHEESCRLVALRPCVIPVQAIKELNTSGENQLELLVRHFADRPFGAQDISKTFGLSKRSAQKLCQAGLKAKVLVQISGGRATRYKRRR